jgi:hypothetical protein
MSDIESGLREFVWQRADHPIALKHGGETVAGNLTLRCTIYNRFKITDIASIDPDTGQLSALFHPRLDGR